MRKSLSVGGKTIACAAFAALSIAFAFDASAQEASTAGKAEARELKYELQPPPANFAPPVLSIEEPMHDWGSVLRGEVVLHSYTVRNTGGSILKITNVKPSCGCTEAGYDKEIPAGGEGKITLKIDTKRFNGALKKTAAVYSNADREPYQLTLTGTVATPLKVDPEYPRIDAIRGSEPKPIEITLTKNTSEELRVTGVNIEETKRDIFTAELKEIEPGKEYKILVTGNPPAETGASTRRAHFHAGELTVVAELGGKTVEVPVRVTLSVKDRITAVPGSIYFTSKDTVKLDTGTAPVTRTVQIKSLDPEHKFAITDVKVQGSHFAASVEPVEGSNSTEYRLIATLLKRPEGDNRRIVEKVLVLTDDPLVPELQLSATASFSVRRNSNN